MSEFLTILPDVLTQNGLDAYTDTQTLARLSHIGDALICAQATMNLSAITEPRQIAVKHLADSLLIAPYLPHGARLLDVGCGGGFPCLPLAAARFDLSITALDSTAKKLEFVQKAAQELQHPDFTVLCGRAEELSQAPTEKRPSTHRECYDVVCARAVANLQVLCELCLPFVRPGGLFFAMKGAKAQQELAQASTAVRKLGGVLQKTLEFSLVDGDERSARTVFIFQKQTKTPSIYPRAYAKILKNPL